MTTSIAMRLGAISLLTAIATQFLGMATGVVAARVLGPEDRGEFALVLLLPMIVTVAGMLGVDRAIVFFSAQKVEDRAILTSSIFFLGLAQGAFATIVAIVAGLLILHDHSQGTKHHLILASFIVPLGMLSAYGQTQLQGQLRMKSWAVARVSEPIGYLMGLACFAAVGQLTVTTAIAAKLLAQIGIILIAWGLVITRAGYSGPSLAKMKSLMSFGIRGYASRLSPADTLQLDQWVVGISLGTTQLAYYVIGLAFLGPAKLVPSALGFVITPLLARDKENAREIRPLIIGSLMFAGVMAIALAVLAAPAIPILFGEQFSGAIAPAQILALGSAALACRELLVSVLLGRGQPGRSSFVEIASATCLIIGLLVLPRWLDLRGAALAVSLSYVVGAVVASYFAVGRARLSSFHRRAVGASSANPVATTSKGGP
jgi:O-antigen/teichoic acid export membrane protein